MDETVVCPGCQVQLALPALPAGQTVQCPRCQRVFEPFRQRVKPAAPMAPSVAIAEDDDESRVVVRPAALRGEKLAAIAMWMLALCCFFYVIQLYLHVERAWVIAEILELDKEEQFGPRRFGQGRLALQVEADRRDQLEERLVVSAERAGTMYFLLNLAYWPTALIYLMWLYRASRNLFLLQAEGVSHTPGWAVGSYFVPIANLFRPCMELQEIWRASDPEQIDDTRAWQKSPATNMIRFWWISLLISSILAFIASRMEPDWFGRGDLHGANLNDQSLACCIYSIANLGMLVAGPLLILIIRGITQRQRERYARLYETPNR